jgi:protein-L-isoaspartate(D-aspartate) O-methyltransferase
MMAAASQSDDPRVERAFELVPREAFLPPGPWKIMEAFGRRYVETPTADPVHLYQSGLVALDANRGINNGEPSLHARWIGAVAPKPGDAITHIGAGAGYYSAILSVLAAPGGRVSAFEIDSDLAQRARINLAPFENVAITHGDATELALPRSDLIYVNAGVVAPPVSWLQALRPHGRMIFPWRPSDGVALALLVTRVDAAWRVKPLMPAWFIPCVGASDVATCSRTPDSAEAWSARSLWLTDERAPDDTAVATYEQLWFSSADVRARQDRPDD